MSAQDKHHSKTSKGLSRWSEHPIYFVQTEWYTIMKEVIAPSGVCDNALMRTVTTRPSDKVNKQNPFTGSS